MADAPTPAPGTSLREPRFIITVLIIVLMALTIAGLMYLPVPDKNRDIIIACISVGIVASVKDIVGWWFGSAAGSAQKDATIAKMAAGAGTGQ